MIKDNFDIDDSLGLKGILIVKDNKTGKVILKKHNMILQDAKKVLLSKLFYNLTPQAEQLDNNVINGLEFFDSNFSLINYSFKEIRLFYNQNEVDYKDTYENLITENTSSYPINITSENLSIESDDEELHYILKFNINISGSELPNDTIFNSLITVMKNYSDLEKNPLLFSRIKFDPIVLTSETELNFSYYIYF